MNDQEKQIKLAEAMGLGGEQTRIADPGSRMYFNPFTDANDDYAVLEWMRRDARRFSKSLTKASPWLYEVGDYARAALKVLK